MSPQLSDAELVTLAVMQALLGFTSEARWIRHVGTHLRHLFPYLPQQSGYNKRLRGPRTDPALRPGPGLQHQPVGRRRLGRGFRPGRGARSRETVRRSDLAGWAEYGYCASHSRWFWGPRLHLVTTLHGLPVGYALTGAKADERQVLLAVLGHGDLPARPGQVIIGDKNYYGRDFQDELAAGRLVLLRPARKGEPEPAGRQYFKPLRQVIESVNDTFKGQLDLEQHGGRTVDGVTVRVLQRILALTAAIWHNDATGQPVMRSLIAYDH
jgi:hypothetical protein